MDEITVTETVKRAIEDIRNIENKGIKVQVFIEGTTGEIIVAVVVNTVLGIIETIFCFHSMEKDY